MPDNKKRARDVCDVAVDLQKCFWGSLKKTETGITVCGRLFCATLVTVKYIISHTLPMLCTATLVFWGLSATVKVKYDNGRARERDRERKSSISGAGKSIGLNGGI